MAQIVTDAAEGVREASEMYAESASNIEDGFGHATYQSEEIQEKAGELESFAEELESAADEIEGLDDPEEAAADIADSGEFEFDPQDPSDPNYDAGVVEDYIAEKREERREAAIEAAHEALNNCPM